MVWTPPAGKVVYGAGHPLVGRWLEANDRLDDAAIRAGEPSLGTRAANYWAMVPGNPVRWPQTLSDLEAIVAWATARDGYVDLGLHLQDGSGNALDREALNGDFDDLIRELAALVTVPHWLRIGVELNGSWNGYTSGVFPDAFAHVASIWRSVAGDLARVVACIESPHGLDPWDADLMPDPSIVDAYGLDLFHDWQGADLTRELITHAERDGKPILLGEASPTKLQAMPERDRITAWWLPLFDLIASAPVEGVCFLSVDWVNAGKPSWQSWGDARFEAQPLVWDWVRSLLRGEHGIGWDTATLPQGLE